MTAQQLLGSAELSELIDRLVRRVERGGALTGSITLNGVTDDERAAIAALFGRAAGSGQTLRVDLDALDRVVVASGAARSLREAVELLRGPLVVRADEAERVRREWERAYARLEGVIGIRPQFEPGIRRLRESGLVRRLTRTADAAAALVGRVCAVLAELPADGEPLQRLAVRTLGSAHALDRGTPEATVVLAVVRASTADMLADASAAARRRAWHSVGVAVDELSSTVLVHRLPLPGVLGELTAAGEPAVLTLRQVRRLQIELPRAPVFVCENPSVVEAAAREIAGGGAALVCVGGQPSLAADVLLRQLAPAGLRYHGDFDWGGIRIANRIYERAGFEPWRYRAADYEAFGGLAHPLIGAPVDAAWDRALRPAMERRGQRVEEEQNLDLLLADLAGG